MPLHDHVISSGFNRSMFLVIYWSPLTVKSLITQDQYYLTQYFQDIMVYFRHQFILTPILARLQHPDLFVPGSDFIGHHSWFPSNTRNHSGILSNSLEALIYISTLHPELISGSQKYFGNTVKLSNTTCLVCRCTARTKQRAVHHTSHWEIRDVSHTILPLRQWHLS